jgi:hypothetical protein
VVPVTGLADKPENVVREHEVLVPTPVILPEHALDVSVTVMESGPVRASEMVAIELVKVVELPAVMSVCCG